MSHLAVNKVEGIDDKKVDFCLVKSAVHLLERVFTIEYVDEVADWLGKNATKVRGIGLKVNGGSYAMDIYMDEETGLSVHSESMMSEAEQDSNFMKEFRKAYTAVATQRALQRAGLSTSLKTVVIGTGKQARAQYKMLGTGGI